MTRWQQAVLKIGTPILAPLVTAGVFLWLCRLALLPGVMWRVIDHEGVRRTFRGGDVRSLIDYTRHHDPNRVVRIEWWYPRTAERVYFWRLRAKP